MVIESIISNETMSDSRRGQQKKNKNEPKEQRKPRTPRTPANLPLEKKLDQDKEKPEVQEPGPEFYKNLKRETDEILKITEESNAKYSKKTIQSNWKKYEAPIETYEEREEVENMGADFEQLVNAPISSGGHFQFKHEKLWGAATEASQYDKYFDINMAELAISLSTIPFYKRNDIDINIFSQNDIMTMEHRANKFKAKYQPQDIEPKEEFVDSTKFKNLALTEKDSEDLMKKEEVIIDEPTENIEYTIDFSKDAQKSDNFELKQVSQTYKTEHSVNIGEGNYTIINSALKNDSKDLSDDDLSKLLIINKETLPNKAKDNFAGISGEENKLLVPKAQMNVPNKEIKEQESEEDLEEWLDDILSK